MYKWFLAWRYLHTKLIAFFGIASVTLCVAMVLVVMSVMGGFLDTVRARSRGLHSEVVLESRTAQGFPYYEEFRSYLAKHHSDIVKLSTPVIYAYGLFRVPATTLTQPARVVGIRMGEYTQVNDFADGLHYNRYYPGSTTLVPQRMPVVGYGANGRMSLPQDLEEANARWRAGESDPAAIEAFDRNPYQVALLPDVVPPAETERVFATQGEAPGYVGDLRDGIIVGCDLLNERRPDGNFNRFIARGTNVALSLLPLTSKGNTTSEPPVVVPLRYVDDSRTGIYDIDKLCVYVDVDMLQHKLAMDAQPLEGGGETKPRVSQLLVGLREGIELNAGRDAVFDAWMSFLGTIAPTLTESEVRLLGFVDVETWEDIQRPFIAAVEKERVLVTFLFSLISVVAIVLVGCVFYMIVEKKTRDIGIMKAVGASGPGVAILFVVYAAAVGVCGAVLGTLLGSTFVWNINDIQDLLAALNPQLRVWSPEIYSFDKIPEAVKSADVWWVGIIAVCSSVFGSLIPAYHAARVWPVAALRYE